jgi:predicted XRE-type DNA-binding protein
MKDVTIGSDNVFADLGFEDAGEMLTRADLTLRIYHILKERSLTPKQAAAILDLPQAEASALMDGKFNDYSIDWLLHLLTRLDQNITIQVKPAVVKQSRGQSGGKIQVLAA